MPAPTPQAPAAAAAARTRIGDFLTKEGLITQAQLLRALEEQRSFGGRLGRHLVDLGFISDTVLQDALARQLGIPRIDLDAPGVVAADASRYARADLAEQWGFCPVEFDHKRNLLVIAMSDPDPQLISDIEGFLAMKVEARVATADAIERTSRRLFHGDGAPVKQMTGLQIARGERKEMNPADALGPPPGPKSAPPSSGGFDPQYAQQLAMQQQLHQFQLQQQLLTPQAMPGGYGPAPTAYAAPPRPAAPAYPPGAVAYPPPAPAYSPPPAPEPPNGGSFLPYSPASLASVEALQEQVKKLEKTLAAQARALRTLVEILVEKDLLTKAEMLKKQQSFEK